MKKILLLLLICGFTFPGFSQENTFDQLIEKGIAYHDAGDYENAIKEYEKALELEPKSGMAHYEIAYSYFLKGDYKSAVKYSEKAIYLETDNQLLNYVMLGNALDMQGKPKKAIKVYEKAMKEYDHYLLSYNYAITCWKEKEGDKAYEATLKAINNNPSHGSSHLLLSEIMDTRGERIKAMLPLYYFLLVEPNSDRSFNEYERLKAYMDLGVERTSPTTINVSLGLSPDSGFGAAEMMLSLQRAANSIPENKDKSEMELFAENNGSVFSILGELKKDNKGFWWEFYVPVFAGIAEAELVEPFSYFISTSQGEEATNWLAENEEKFTRLKKWFEK